MNELNRRTAVQTLLAGLAAASATGLAACAATPTAATPARFAAGLQRVEQATGGRLGVAVIDTATGAVHGHRADERFAMCSTFKMLVAAFVLHRVDAGQESLSRQVRFGPADKVDYAPVTDQLLPDGVITVGALCDAILTWSDNTAANLLLRSFGGPAGLTAHARTLGDDITRLDRTEPTLNTAIPGDPRDTTTPRAMAATLRRILLGDALTPASREQLTAWMVNNQTGSKKLKAGAPVGWHVADKTGAGANGTSNDIAVMWPPTGAPLVVCSYLTEAKVKGEALDRAHAEVGALAAALRS